MVTKKKAFLDQNPENSEDLSHISFNKRPLNSSFLLTHPLTAMAVGFKHLSLLLGFSAIAASATAGGLRSIQVGNDDDQSCVYTLYVRTGSIWKGGTDSKINLALAGSDGNGLLITNLEEWGGLMGGGYNYFERGNLDIFSGRGPCLSSPPCWMNLTSDGSGPHHGWYCNYVEVTFTGPHLGCSQTRFTVEQWLAMDTSPYQLYATRDYCYASNGDGRISGERPLVRAVGLLAGKIERD